MREPDESGTRQPERRDEEPDGDEDYAEWRDGLASFSDGRETLFVVWGDAHMNEEQLKELWAREHPSDDDDD